MVQINRDPEIARYLNRPVDDAAIAAFYGQVVAHWEHFGFGPWAVASAHTPTAGRFLGFVGLAHVPPFMAAARYWPEWVGGLSDRPGAAGWRPRLPSLRVRTRSRASADDVAQTAVVP